MLLFANIVAGDEISYNQKFWWQFFAAYQCSWSANNGENRTRTFFDTIHVHWTAAWFLLEFRQEWSCDHQDGWEYGILSRNSDYRLNVSVLHCGIPRHQLMRFEISTAFNIRQFRLLFYSCPSFRSKMYWAGQQYSFHGQKMTVYVRHVLWNYVEWSKSFSLSQCTVYFRIPKRKKLL